MKELLVRYKVSHSFFGVL